MSRLTLVLLAAALAAPATALGQKPAAVPKDSAAPPAPETMDTALVPIPTGEIPAEADRALTLVAEAFGSLGAPAQLDELLDGIPAFTDSLEAEDDVSLLSGRGLLTRRGLSNLTLAWAARDGRVQAMQRELKRQAGLVDSARGRLGRALGRWRITVADHDSTTPREIAARAAEVVVSLTAVDSVLAVRTHRILDGELALSRARTRIFTQQLALSAAQRQARRDLLRLESPPIWRDPLNATLTSPMQGGVLRALPEMRWFRDQHAVGLLFHVLLTALLALAAYRYRGSLRETMEQAAAGHYSVLRRPVPALLLVSIALALWFYPRAPLVFYDLVLVLAAFPLLALLPDLVGKDMLQPARLAVGFLVLQRLATIATLGTPVFRLAQLVLSIVGAVMLWYGLAPGAPLRASDGAPRWHQLVERLSWGLLGTFVVAALANIVGNVSLADALNAGVATSAFVGILLLAVAQIMDVFASEAIRLGSPYSRYLAQRGEKVDRLLVGAVNVAAAIGWAVVTLQVFFLYGPLVDRLRRLLGATISVGAASLSVGRILTFLVVLWIGVLLSRLISGLLELDVLGRMDLRRGMAVTVGSLVRYALIAVAFLWAVAAMGVELSNVAILGGALGVGIGFGLQNVVNNFVSGMLLAFERPVGVGDTVQVGPHTGDVKEIGIRASVIRTFDGAEVIVPNSELVTKDVINWTRTGTRRRFEITVGTAYGSDPAKVIGLLLDAAIQHPEVRGNPEPMALFTGFGESSLDFVLRAWTDNPNWGQVRSDVAVTVNELLRGAGIEIPFPQRDLHVRSVAPETLRTLARGEGTDAVGDRA